MKNRIILPLLLCLTTLGSFSANAERQSAPNNEEYKFRFVMSRETYDYEITSSSYQAAFETAAKACFGHFKSGRHLSEDQGLDIIDVCANPRKI